MSRPIFTNNATAPVDAPLNTYDTQVSVQPGYGALFPAPVGEEYFTVTLEDRRTSPITREVAYCISRTGDTLILRRAQEGTSAKPFNAGFVVSHRLTAAQIMAITGAMVTFNDLWLGVHPTPPTVGNDGGPIPTGAMYFNSTTDLLYTWSDNGWKSITEPARALTVRLFYDAADGETQFGHQLDLYGQTLTLTDTEKEPVLVFKNGELLKFDDGTPEGAFGDYTIDWFANRVTLKTPTVATDFIELQQLVPVSRLPPSATDTRGLRDINLDPVTSSPGMIDGVRTTFSLRGLDNEALSVDDPWLTGIFLDGVHQRPQADYTCLGNDLMFNEAPPAGTTFWGYYYGVRGGTILTVPLPTVVGQVLVADDTLHPAWSTVVDEGTY